MPRHIITVDLGNGDSGKGTIVDSLVRQYGIGLVARTSGGCQCAHSVITPEGTHHIFAQFGSGTFGGAQTLLMKNVLVDPLRLMKEGEVLATKGIINPFSLIHVDERCLVTTPYHAAVNQAKEAVRGNKRHGSCGVGIGETAAYALRYPESALRIGDLLTPHFMREKLVQMRVNLEQAYDEVADNYFGPPGVIEGRNPFRDEHFLDALCWRYADFIKKVRTHRHTESFLSHQDVVFEGAQGVLLDEDYGFHPYTTWSRVTSRNAVEALKEAGVDDWTTIGIMRSYAHRHGAGPFPTQGEQVAEPHNPTNAWQGDFRTGTLDLAAIDYSLRVQEAIGDKVDYLAVTHMDRVEKVTHVVTGYEFPLYIIDPADFVARERQTNNLMTTDSRDFSRATTSDLPAFIADNLGIPIGITSSGPKHGDKVHLSLD